MNGMSPDRLVFFLGGRDLEMVTIRALLQAHAPTMFHDKGLAWGARASAYQGEIESALAEGKTPVLIELENDLGLDPAMPLRTSPRDIFDRALAPMTQFRRSRPRAGTARASSCNPPRRGHGADDPLPLRYGCGEAA